MKKIIAFLMVVTISLCTLSTTAFAYDSTTYSKETEYVKTKSRKSVTIADVDEKMGELTMARLSNNREAKEQILKDFPDYGINSVSLEELQAIIDPEGNTPVTYASTNIDYNTVYSDITVDGKDLRLYTAYLYPRQTDTANSIHMTAYLQAAQQKKGQRFQMFQSLLPYARLILCTSDIHGQGFVSARRSYRDSRIPHFRQATCCCCIPNFDLLSMLCSESRTGDSFFSNRPIRKFSVKNGTAPHCSAVPF